MKFAKHTQIIKRIIIAKKASNYLEIGVEKGDNFFNIPCYNKVGVDVQALPKERESFLSEYKKFHQMTSDDFFEKIAPKEYKEGFDVIFVDASHEHKQALKDVQNALNTLKEDGVIIMPDCNPETKGMQQIPRIQDVWTGNVWKAVVDLRSDPNLHVFVLDCDFGCGIVMKGKPESLVEQKDYSYEDLVLRREELLNLKDPSYLDTFLDKIRK